MTLNEKFLNVTGLSLDVESMIKSCPADQKQSLYDKLNWYIGLLLSTTTKEGKFTSDGSEKAETLKQIYNLLISTPIADATALKEIFDNLIAGESKSLEISEDIKTTSALIVENGCSVLLNIPEGKAIDVSKCGYMYGFVATGEMEISGPGYVTAKTSGSTGSRLFRIIDGGSVKINDGVFSANVPVANNGGTITINGGDFTSVEPCVLFEAAYTDTNVIINNGDFTATDNGVLMGNGTKVTGKTPCKVKVNGGVFNGGIKSDGYIANGIYCPSFDEIEIDGATFNITDGCCVLARAGKVTVKNTTINMIYTDKALESGKVGDSRIVVPCVPFVFDEAAKYPMLDDDSRITIGENVVINYSGEYAYSGKKAVLVTTTSYGTSVLFDNEIDTRIYGI